MSDGALRIIFVTGVAAGMLVRGWHTRNRKRMVRTRHHSLMDTSLVGLSAFGFLAIPLVYLLTPWLGAADYPWPAPAWVGWLGAAFFAGSVWMLWRSHADLGQNWSPLPEIQEDHSLVTVGVYRWIRHPMYASFFLWGVAQALLIQNWIAGPAQLVGFIPLYLWRVPREERMMLGQFGDAYREYMGRTGRIVPRLRR